MKKNILIYAGIILFFLILSYSFAPQVLEGKVVNQSDISGYVGMSRETNKWNSEHPDDVTAWTGSMFSGMPTVAFQTPNKGDWTQKIYNALLFIKKPVGYLFISLVGAFLLMLSLGISPLIAAGGAIAVTFCAYNFQIIQVGHNTKMQAIAFLPWVLASLIVCYRSIMADKEKKKKWFPRTLLWSVLFGLFVSFQVKANHPQISYYLAILILLYALSVLVWLLISPERRKNIGRFFAASALLLSLGLVGIATNATKLIPIWEYTPFSIRGGSQASSDNGGNEKKGLDLEYATAWSYGWQELPNLFIPNFNGGSSAAAVNPDKSETIALLRQANQPNLKEIAKSLPMYWGPQPFTAGPMYVGAISFFLFILGLCLCRGKEKWWIVATSILAVALGLGHNLMGVTRFFFEYAPLYNKFRAVSMTLVILQFTIPMLGFLVLDRITRDEGFSASFRKKGWIAYAITGGFCFLMALFPGIAGDFHSATDAAQQSVIADAFAADRRALLVNDAWRSFLFISAAFALIWICTSKKKTGSRGMLALGVCFLVLIDLFAVGKRYLNADHFITPKKFNSQFTPRQVDNMILEDKDPSYRVLDLTVDVFNDSHPSYLHKNIGGYSPAKLGIYQDYINRHLNSEIMEVGNSLRSVKTIAEAVDALPYLKGLSSLNCRYIIIDPNLPPIRYKYARGNAWFEGSEGSIVMTSYAPNELRYIYHSEEGGKAVFSEVYYPEGWKATVDGQELEISLTDEVLRSVVLPAGAHEVVMRFEPSSYARGEAVSRASSIVIFLLIILSAGAMVADSKKRI